jgi:hypothetical protein
VRRLDRLTQDVIDMERDGVGGLVDEEERRRKRHEMVGGRRRRATVI